MLRAVRPMLCQPLASNNLIQRPHRLMGVEGSSLACHSAMAHSSQGRAIAWLLRVGDHLRVLNPKVSSSHRLVPALLTLTGTTL